MMCALKNNKVNESRKTVGSIFTVTVRNYLFDAVAFELKTDIHQRTESTGETGSRWTQKATEEKPLLHLGSSRNT